MRQSLLLASIMALICLIVLLDAVNAENWPQWRGPMLNGISNEKDLPVKWSMTENLAWKLAMPDRSASTPIVWGEQIFLNVADGKDLYLWSVDRQAGGLLWKRRLGGENHRQRKQNMSSPSPVTDGEKVWVITGAGILKCFDFKGHELWERDIQRDYGRFGLNHGYSSSPLLYGDSIFLQVVHGTKTDQPSYLLRIDKQTGKTIWRLDRPANAKGESRDSYATPALLKDGDTVQIVVLGADCVTGHDLATGKELWRGNGLNPTNNDVFHAVASPVVYDGVIYAPARVKPLTAFRVGGEADITDTHRLWTSDRGPHVTTPVTDGQYLYVVGDNGVMWCLNAKTGAEIYGRQRLKSGTYSSSPVLADGKLYISNEDGLTTVVKAGPKFEILAENQLEGFCLSTPAISDGQIFIRTAQNLYCVGRRVTRGVTTRHYVNGPERGRETAVPHNLTSITPVSYPHQLERVPSAHRKDTKRRRQSTQTAVTSRQSWFHWFRQNRDTIWRRGSSLPQFLYSPPFNASTQVPEASRKS